MGELGEIGWYIKLEMLSSTKPNKLERKKSRDMSRVP